MMKKVIKSNKKLWENYERFARARGRLVANLLSRLVDLDGAKILDFGCGTGGIAVALSEARARVTAFDHNEHKLETLKTYISKKRHHITIVHTLPNQSQKFDAIILTDVVEHLLHPVNVLQELNKRLKPGGTIYLSTPNRHSIINLIMDPHFSLPVVSLLRRNMVKRIVASFLKWQPQDRLDFPELISLKKLDWMLRKSGFAWFFVNSFVVRYAVNHPASVWNRNSHLTLIRAIQKIGAVSFVQKCTSDKVNFYSRWINPTWYIIAQKKPDSA